MQQLRLRCLLKTDRYCLEGMYLHNKREELRPPMVLIRVGSNGQMIEFWAPGLKIG